MWRPTTTHTERVRRWAKTTLPDPGAWPRAAAKSTAARLHEHFPLLDEATLAELRVAGGVYSAVFGPWTFLPLDDIPEAWRRLQE